MDHKRFIPADSVSLPVNDIEHIESTSYNGIGVVKIYLQPNASVPVAMAQLTAASQAVLKQLPPGETPPLILSFSASNVPVLRLGLSGANFSEQQLNDLALNFLRVQLVTVPGAAVPWPYGGKMRVVSIDINSRNFRPTVSRGIPRKQRPQSIQTEDIDRTQLDLRYREGLQKGTRSAQRDHSAPLQRSSKSVPGVRGIEDSVYYEFLVCDAELAQLEKSTLRFPQCGSLGRERNSPAIFSW